MIYIYGDRAFTEAEIALIIVALRNLQSTRGWQEQYRRCFAIAGTSTPVNEDIETLRKDIEALSNKITAQ